MEIQTVTSITSNGTEFTQIQAEESCHTEDTIMQLVKIRNITFIRLSSESWYQVVLGELVKCVPLFVKEVLEPNYTDHKDKILDLTDNGEVKPCNNEV